MQHKAGILLALLAPALALAQGAPELRQILDRLERLERANQQLAEEVHALRRELAAARPAEAKPPSEAPAEPSVEERLAVQERRTEELAQTKVEAGHRLPVTLTGTLLFNAFWNGRYGGDAQYPLTAQASPGLRNAGGSLRQSIIGLRFDGPEIAGGQVSGNLYTDFFAGSANSLNHLLRLRTGTIQIDWKDTSLMAGQEKPIIAPRDPHSLAQVGISPLTAAGNLWMWQPQVRAEQRFHFGESAGLNARMGIFETIESSATNVPEYQALLTRDRPGLEGRFELWKQFGGPARIEIAPGFHASSTRLLGASLPSRIVSVDWLIKPAALVDFTGTFFSGSNVAVLGSLRQGIVVVREVPHSVRSMGGWAELSFHPLPRLSFNAFTGQQDDRNRDLVRGLVAKNLVVGGNVMYRLGPNVMAALEASRIRTTYLGTGVRLVNHYDLALAYLF